MPVELGPYLDTKDIYIDYPFELVMFRRMKGSGSVYRKFYGEAEFTEVIDGGNELYREALRFGEEITQEDYDIGKSQD